MAKRLQLRGGTTAEHSTFTGASREVTIDTTKKTAVVHDGSTAGGIPLAKYSDVTSHTSNTSNPHSVTATQVGLGNVDNTSDANKPVSTAQATAIGLKADQSTTYTKTEVDTIINGFEALPDQTGNGGKYLTTDGTDASWAELETDFPMSNDSIPVGTSFTIPSGKQLIVDHLDVAGTLDIQGTLATVTGGSLTQTTMKTQSIVNSANASNPVDFPVSPTIDGNYLTPFSGFKNRIINGDMRIWQRGTSFSSGYTADRFMIAGGSSITISQSSDVPTSFKNSISITGGSYVGIQQRIESLNCYDLSGQSVTISFWAKQSTGVQIQLALYYAGSSDNFSSVTQIGSTQNFNATSTWAQYSVTFTSLPSGVLNGLQLLFGANTSSSTTFYITGVQLEEGSVATPFENRPYGLELSLCQRYYFTTYPSGDIAGKNYGSTQVGSTSALILLASSGQSSKSACIEFKNTMRTIPTCTFYSILGTSSKSSSSFSLIDVSSSSIDYTVGGICLGTNQVSFFMPNQGDGRYVSAHIIASAEL